MGGKIDLPFAPASDTRLLGSLGHRANQTFQRPWPDKLSFNRHIVGVCESSPWQFSFIFSDKTRVEMPMSGFNAHEHMIKPEAAAVKYIRLQTTLKNELRGIELADEDNKSLLKTFNVDSQDDYYQVSEFKLKDGERILGIKTELRNAERGLGQHWDF